MEKYKVSWIFLGCGGPLNLNVIDTTDKQINSFEDVIELYKKADELVTNQLKKMRIYGKVAHQIALWHYSSLGHWVLIDRP